MLGCAPCAIPMYLEIKFSSTDSFAMLPLVKENKQDSCPLTPLVVPSNRNAVDYKTLRYLVSRREATNSSEE